MDRIFTVCHITQLLVVQHLRRHLQLPPAREFLVWTPLGTAALMVDQMHSVISSAGFVDTLDMRDFQSVQPRTQGPMRWGIEAARRQRRDAATVRAWMKANGIAEDAVELWADDPIHFNGVFLRGLLRKARHVKIPHCFNHEDETSLLVKSRFEAQRRETSWAKRALYWPWLELISGVQQGAAHRDFDMAYTFDRLSCWAEKSVDVSGLISFEAFDATYRTLPASVRDDVERMLLPLQNAARPLVLLLLFGLGGPAARETYQRSVARIFAERAAQLNGCTLAVKLHPGSSGHEEERLFEWLTSNVPAQVHPIRSTLNLEFMLPQLRPDYVWAGPCGALPIVGRLQVGQPIVLPEINEMLLHYFPDQRQDINALVRGIEAW